MNTQCTVAVVYSKSSYSLYPICQWLGHWDAKNLYISPAVGRHIFSPPAPVLSYVSSLVLAGQVAWEKAPKAVHIGADPTHSNKYFSGLQSCCWKTRHTAGPNSSIRRRFLATEYLMACKTPCETVNKITSYLKLLAYTYTCLSLSCLTLLQLLNHDKPLCRKEPCLAKYM